MKSYMLYFEKFLRALGFKKFMWMHVVGLIVLLLILSVGLIEVIISGTFKKEEAMIALGGFIIMYIGMRAFQAVFEKKVLEDSYMFFWTGNKKKLRKFH